MIILASQSPRRQKLLEITGLPFVVEPSNCDETYDPNDAPSEIVQILAKQKAAAVAAGRPEALVIGADTIVVFQNDILEKPASTQEAKKMLQALSGNKHKVLSGVSLIKTDSGGNILKDETFFESTTVYFGKPEPYEIASYVAGGSPLDKAGGYGIQDDWGSLFVRRIEGDYNNVVGLPLFALYQRLKTFAPELLQQSRISRQL